MGVTVHLLQQKNPGYICQLLPGREEVGVVHCYLI